MERKHRYSQGALEGVLTMMKNDPDRFIKQSRILRDSELGQFLFLHQPQNTRLELANTLYPHSIDPRTNNNVSGRARVRADLARFGARVLGAAGAKKTVAIKVKRLGEMLIADPLSDEVATRKYWNKTMSSAKLFWELIVYASSWDPDLDPEGRYGIDSFLRHVLWLGSVGKLHDRMNDGCWKRIRYMAEYARDFSHRTKAYSILSYNYERYFSDIGLVHEIVLDLPSQFREVRRKEETPINALISPLPWLPIGLAKLQRHNVVSWHEIATSDHTHTSSTTLALLSLHVEPSCATAFFHSLLDWVKKRESAIRQEEEKPAVRTAAYCLAYLNGLAGLLTRHEHAGDYSRNLTEIMQHCLDHNEEIDLIKQIACSLIRFPALRPTCDYALRYSIPTFNQLSPDVTVSPLKYLP